MSEICCKLHRLFSKLRRFHFPFNAEDIPDNGVYILFEKGESAHGTDRIVRVGTHRGNDNLSSRLDEHFINTNKDRSIFRKNIGRAILNQNNDGFLADWNKKLTKAEIENRYPEGNYTPRVQEIERMVTTRIQENFYFAVFKIAEQAKRLELESKIISTVSLCDGCPPSENWFGLLSPKNKIKESGLWLIQGLYKKQLSEDDYKLLEDIVLNQSSCSAI
jgi:hypothetical protein